MKGEEYLYAVTVGERVPHNDTIELAPYDPLWPSRFAMLAERIRGALGDQVLLLEHVGSTSVPGLCAKPVIDMVLAVPDSSDEPSYVPALEAAGFRLRIREPDWFAHRCFGSLPVKGNLHVFSAGCEEIARMLRFRDWLRAHDEDRRAYEERKRELAVRKWKHVQDYADAKTGIVHEILARAFSAAEG
jgi:GrpB-like predicted nucleotidyltransferase (UPF0157 family)